MTTEQYDQLLYDIEVAKRRHREAMDRVIHTELELHGLLTKLSQEESRIAREALVHMPIASRKLVVGE